MAKYKDEQKAIKAPDELQKLGEEALPFIEKHGRALVLGIGAVLAVGLVVAITSSMKSSGNETAARDFGAALKVLDRPVNATATDLKPGEDAPFKSETEKDEAIIKALTEFRAAHGGTVAATSAALPLAQAKLRQGKPEEALPLVDEFLSKADANDPLRPAAYEARGYALEAQKKYDDALAAFDQLAADNKTDFMKGMGLYHRGRMLQLKGDTEGAARVFVDVESKDPNTAASRLAKDRITMLAAQGVSIPQAAPVAPAADAGL